MAATSDVEICNSALRKLGVAPITTLSDDSEPARVMNFLYDKRRDKLMREHPWNFAVFRAALVSTGNTPAFHYAYEFALPTDYLRILETYPEDAEWQRENTTIVSNESSLSVRYIKKVTTVTAWDTTFAELLSLDLAHEACMTLTGDKTLKEALSKELERDTRSCRTMDAQEGGLRQLQANDWRNSRY